MCKEAGVTRRLYRKSCPMAAAKEISTDAAIVAGLSELGGIFYVKRRTKNGTEDFSKLTVCFRFTPNFL